MIKTARHLHACVILSAQTIVDSLNELKRIATDLVIWKNVSQSDMEKVLSDIPLPVNQGVANTKEYIMKLHQQLPDKRSKIIINIVNNNVTVEN